MRQAYASIVVPMAVAANRFLVHLQLAAVSEQTYAPDAPAAVRPWLMLLLILVLLKLSGLLCGLPAYLHLPLASARHRRSGAGHGHHQAHSTSPPTGWDPCEHACQSLASHLRATT